MGDIKEIFGQPLGRSREFLRRSRPRKGSHGPYRNISFGFLGLWHSGKNTAT